MDSVSGAAASKSSLRYRFADLTLDLGQHRLWRGGDEIGLSKLSYELVRALVEAAPNLVTHDQLAESVWGPRRIVTPENLAKRVMMLRQALGDHADAPRYIEGVRGQGYRLIPAVEIVDSALRTESSPRATRPWNVRYALAGLAFMALGLVAVDRYASRATGSVAQRSSIAVLPCENHSAATENAAFWGAGLRNELLTQLGKISALKVVENVASQPRDSRAIGRELGVATILACTVQRAGDALLVSVRLVDTQTDEQLWAESYRREYTTEEIFAIQRDIATSIALVLKVRLTPQEVERLANLPTDNMQAYELYLAANRDVMTPADATGGKQLEQALELDPGFAEAWGLKAAGQAQSLTFAPPDQAAKLATEAQRDAQRAVELRPESVVVRVGNAAVLDGLGDWVAAKHEHEAVFALGGRRSSRAYILHNVAVGYFEEARRDIEESLERAPIDTFGWAYLLAIHGLLGETGQEEEVFARGNALHGEQWWGGLHEFYFRLGRTRTVNASLPKHPEGHDLSVYLDSPHAGAAEVRRLAQTEGFLATSAGKIHLALWAALFGDDDFAMELLAAAFEHTGSNAWFIWMPLLHETRQHPDFERLLVDLGLVEYWDEFGWPSICRRVDHGIECD